MDNIFLIQDVIDVCKFYNNIKKPLSRPGMVQSTPESLTLCFFVLLEPHLYTKLTVIILLHYPKTNSLCVFFSKNTESRGPR